jgi:hypothetical protein
VVSPLPPFQNNVVHIPHLSHARYIPRQSHSLFVIIVTIFAVQHVAGHYYASHCSHLPVHTSWVHTSHVAIYRLCSRYMSYSLMRSMPFFLPWSDLTTARFLFSHKTGIHGQAVIWTQSHDQVIELPMAVSITTGRRSQGLKTRVCVCRRCIIAS